MRTQTSVQNAFYSRVVTPELKLYQEKPMTAKQCRQLINVFILYVLCLYKKILKNHKYMTAFFIQKNFVFTHMNTHGVFSDQPNQKTHPGTKQSLGHFKAAASQICIKVLRNRLTNTLAYK